MGTTGLEVMCRVFSGRTPHRRDEIDSIRGSVGSSMPCGAHAEEAPTSSWRKPSQERIRSTGMGSIPFIVGILQFAVVPGIVAQENPLQPSLREAALWSLDELSSAAEPGRIQTYNAERRQPYLVMASASTLGSLVGAGVGIVVGVNTTDSLAGLIIGYPGAWVGSAVGADLTGATLSRSLLGSTVGLVAGGLCSAGVESVGDGQALPCTDS